jgi:hypothetical protein
MTKPTVDERGHDLSTGAYPVAFLEGEDGRVSFWTLEDLQWCWLTKDEFDQLIEADVNIQKVFDSKYLTNTPVYSEPGS